jgi:predicted nucleotidyltransferase
MDKTTALEHAKRYAALVYDEAPFCKVILYGSLANGNFNENSDIDIAVVQDFSDDNYWELSKKLNRLTRNIDNRLVG